MTLKRKVIKRPGWYVSFGLGCFWLVEVGKVEVEVGCGLLV